MISIITKLAVNLLIASGIMKPTTDAIIGTITKSINGLEKVSQKHQKAHTKAEAEAAAAETRRLDAIRKANERKDAQHGAAKAKAQKARDEFTKAERVKQKLSDLVS